MRVSIVGAGRVGTAIACLLSERGYEVVGVADISLAARERASEMTGARPMDDPVEAAREADIIFITTPDSAIEETARLIAGSGLDVRGKEFIHMSGALTLDALEPVGGLGARVISIHPLQTFADLRGALAALSGSTFGVTCGAELEESARALVSDLGGETVLVEDSDKALYHAAAVLACNLVNMVTYGAQVLARESGYTDEQFATAFIPLVKATVDNISRLGPAAALTGPLARGDLETIETHLEALDRFEPALAAMYRAVCLWGLRLVAERGDLDPDTIAAMRLMIGGQV